MLYCVIFLICVILSFSCLAVRGPSFPNDTRLFTFSVCDHWDMVRTLLSLVLPKVFCLCLAYPGLNTSNAWTYALGGQLWHAMSNATLLGPQTAVAEKIEEVFTRSEVKEVIFVSDKGNYAICNDIIVLCNLVFLCLTTRRMIIC